MSNGVKISSIQSPEIRAWAELLDNGDDVLDRTDLPTIRAYYEATSDDPRLEKAHAAIAMVGNCALNLMTPRAFNAAKQAMYSEAGGDTVKLFGRRARLVNDRPTFDPAAETPTARTFRGEPARIKTGTAPAEMYKETPDLNAID